MCSDQLEEWQSEFGNGYPQRNFEQHYLTASPSLKIVREGYWEMDNGLDRTHRWLFEK